MTTKNPRINITFDRQTTDTFSLLANKEKKSLSRLVRELALEALETKEDLYLSRIAEKLDIKGSKTVTHEEAWEDQ